jgi:hypothetical protein
MGLRVRFGRFAMAVVLAALVLACYHHVKRRDSFRRLFSFHVRAAIHLYDIAGCVERGDTGRYYTEAEVQKVAQQCGIQRQAFTNRTLARLLREASDYHFASANRYASAWRRPWHSVETDPPAPPLAFPSTGSFDDLRDPDEL